MEKFQIGDEVEVVEEVKGNSARVGSIGILEKIDNTSIPYGLYNPNWHDTTSWCRKIKLVNRKSIDNQLINNFIL